MQIGGFALYFLWIMVFLALDFGSVRGERVPIGVSIGGERMVQEMGHPKY